jgi:hypothetical protein
MAGMISKLTVAGAKQQLVSLERSLGYWGVGALSVEFA